MEAATATTTQAPTPPPSPTDAPETPQEGTQEATGAVPEAPKTPEAPPKRFRKLKVNGAETEVDEESLILAGMRAEQKERAAQERWKAAQQAQAQVDAFTKAWETDPVGALDQLGPKAREAAEKFLMRELQREQMDPRERDCSRNGPSGRSWRPVSRPRRTRRPQAEQQRVQEHYVQQLDVEFAEVMKTANLPEDDRKRAAAGPGGDATDRNGHPADPGEPPGHRAASCRRRSAKMATSVMGQMDGPGLLEVARAGHPQADPRGRGRCREGSEAGPRPGARAAAAAAVPGRAAPRPRC